MKTREKKDKNAMLMGCVGPKAHWHPTVLLCGGRFNDE
jgi:hypothetical protein